MTSKKVNDFVLKVTENKNLLPNSGNLDEAYFLYKNWKVTDANNSNSKVIGIEEDKGRNKYELMRRICALGNAGGGILFWGINEETLRVDGIKLTAEERQKIRTEMKQWHNEYHGRLHLKKNFLKVIADPL